MFKTRRFFSLALILPVALLLTPLAHAAWPELDRSVDDQLQSRLEQNLADLGLDRAADQRRLSVALTDITDLEHPRFAAVNPNNMVYAASLPKIAILLGAFKRIESGEMQLDNATRDTMTRMIRVSSNTAASEMLGRVGMGYLGDLLRSPVYRLYDPARNGGLWVGRPYGKGGETRRDPLHNLSHGATALQVSRFYYLLETGRLLSPELTAEMKSMLGDPGIHHKFVKGLESERPGARIYRKSGSWRNWHADSAIVERDGRRYIAVALAEDPQGGDWLRRLIVRLDQAVFDTAPRTLASAKGPRVALLK